MIRESTWDKTGQPCPCGDGADNTGINKDGSAKCFNCSKFFPDYEKACELGGNVEVNNEMAVRKDAPNETNGEYLDLTDRKITKETCKVFGVKAVQGTEGIRKHLYPYYDNNGTLAGNKVRHVEKKSFFYEGTRTSNMFGQNLFKPGCAKILTVVEGELDAMAAYQMMRTPRFSNPPVISMSFGAQSAVKDFKANLEYLESFDNVVLCFDADKPGQDAVKAVCKLLKPGRCKIMRLPKGMKDANDMLINNKSGEFVKAFWNAELYVPSGILNITNLKTKFFKEEAVESIPMPWEGLNEKLFGLRKKELVTLTGGTGLGKSSVTRELEHWILKQTKERVGVLALEEDWKRTTMGIVSIEADQRLFIDQIRKEYPQDKIEAIYEKLFEGANADRFYVHAHLGIQNIDDIFAKLRYLIVGCDCQWVVVDHLHMMVAAHQEGDERRVIDDIMMRLRSLVEETGCGMILVSHLRRGSGDKGHEQGMEVSLSHLRGSASIGQISDTVIALERNQQADDKEEANRTVLRVLKCRHTGDTGIACHLQYSPDTGRLKEYFPTFDEFDAVSKAKVEDNEFDF